MKRKKIESEKKSGCTFSPFPALSHYLIQSTKMSECRVCQEVRFAIAYLCRVPNCDSAVCAGCALELIRHGRSTCICCRTPYPPEIAQELEHAAQPPLLPFPPLQNVREPMDTVGSPPRRVRRRLFEEDRQTIDQFYINGMLHCPEVVRPCTELLSYNFSFRWDTTSSERRFLLVNGLANDILPASDLTGTRTGFTTSRYTSKEYYCSSRPNHLPPIPFGPLYLGDRSLIPESVKQAFEECKFFYLRDQVERNYNPWTFGHRPWTGGQNRAMNTAVNCDDIYTEAVRVAVQLPYTYSVEAASHRGTFINLAFAWCMQAGLLPQMRLLTRHNNRFYNISPVHSSRMRVLSDPNITYMEFDLVCMLSIRADDSDNAPWRSGVFLFFRFSKTNGQWTITPDSCALSPHRGNRKITINDPWVGLDFHTGSNTYDSIATFIRMFP